MDGHFLEGHLATDDLLERLDRSIDRAVANTSSLEDFVGDLETNSCDWSDALAGGYLQRFELNVVVLGLFSASEHQQVIVIEFLLLVGQTQECLVGLIKFLLLKFYTEDT